MYKHEKVSRLTFNELPGPISDTLSNMFNRSQMIDYEDSKEGKPPKFSYSNFILLDSSYSRENLEHVVPYSTYRRPIKPLGTYFTINGHSFFKPYFSEVLNMTIYKNKMYVMLDQYKEVERIYDTDDIRAFKVYYEYYYYWVIDLE